jgi:tRNA-dihydrouridine synthase 3
MAQADTKPTSMLSTTESNQSTASSINGSNRNDPYSLQLKAEYVLNERSSNLPPLSSEHTSILVHNSVENNMDTENGDRNSNKNNYKNKKKERQQRKKRPRDDRIDSVDKICLAVLRGEVCPYNDKCRFGHDMKAYLATRQPDIAELGTTCPIYESTGYCPYGVLCRIGSCHINMATGANIMKTSKDSIVPAITNTLTKDIQIQLRKNIYPFKCKRHYEKSEKNKQKEAMQQERNKDDRISGDMAVAISKPMSGDSATPLDEEVQMQTVNSETIQDTGIIADSVASLSKVDNEASKTDAVLKDDIVKTSIIGGNGSLDPLPSRTKKLIDFSNKIYVAPLTTVGNLPFRRIMKDYGTDITCGEMALAQGILEGKGSEWALLKRHSCEDIFGVQIAAGFPDMYTRTVELIENHTSVDFVDLNLGCPLDLVCDKGSGAALMLRDTRLRECLKGICSTLSCPITIKMRTGWDEKKPIAYNLVQKISSWDFSDDIATIMIHGRSRLQRYSKEADWEYIRSVAMTAQDMESDSTKSRRIIPIVGNGDIMNFTDYEKNVLAYASADEDSKGKFSTCAMLARGALIKPWLPTEIKERRHWDISASERMDILKTFVKYGLENWGTDQQGINNCRRFLLEWLSFLHRYVPVGILEYTNNNGPQQMNQRPPPYMCGRNDLETLFLSNQSCDWIKISEMLLGPVPDGFQFEPKHKANSFVKSTTSTTPEAVVASW